MKFMPKKDWWLSAINWGGMLLAIGGSFFALIAATYNIFVFLILVIVGVGVPLLMIWTWLTTYYVVNETHLIIRYGPFKTTIPLEAIKSIQKTNNPISSPAPSLKRLEIQFNAFDSVLISPKDRDAFMEYLSEHCPHVSIKNIQS
ncbi:PH domain-containing protein (plasmid) [Niallia taxi]|uniref:PH domain-containing protein n=1 Tax=Niallia taxi TaxID=2499688 RepID=UPI0029350365|nr:PH domain-containing protein [Niallia taxi]WOD64791.1 PH domain-containing protein [Niallia taxi]